MWELYISRLMKGICMYDAFLYNLLFHLSCYIIYYLYLLLCADCLHYSGLFIIKNEHVVDRDFHSSQKNTGLAGDISGVKVLILHAAYLILETNDFLCIAKQFLEHVNVISSTSGIT